MKQLFFLSIFLDMSLASFCFADAPFAYYFLKKFSDKLDRQGTYNQQNLKEMVRKILIDEELILRTPFTREASFSDSIRAYLNSIASKVELKAHIDLCHTILGRLAFTNGTPQNEQINILRELNTAGLSNLLLDSVVEKVYRMLIKYNILEHVQNATAETIDTLLSDGPSAILLRGNEPYQSAFEKIALFILECAVTFEKEPGYWVCYYLGSGQNIQGPKGQTVFSHVLNSLKETNDNTGLPLLEGDIETLCKAIIEYGDMFSNTGLDIYKLNVNLQDNKGQNTLHIAALYTSEKLCELLLSRGADVKAVDMQGDSPLHLAISSEDQPVSLLSSSSHAARTGKIVTEQKRRICKKLLGQGAPVNLANRRGHTPLHRAVTSGEESLAQVILEGEKVHVNAPNNAQQTPFHLSCILGNAPLMELLIDYEALTSGKDNFGNRPIHYACFRTSTLNMFFTAGLETLNDAGWSPLHFAVYFNNVSAITYLLSKKVDVNLQIPASGKTALMLGCENGRIEICRILLDQPSLNIKVRDAAKRSALEWACEFGDEELCSLLLKRGFSKQAPYYKVQLLRRACQQDEPLIYSFFNAWKSDLKNTDKKGRTVLSIAREKNYVDVVEILQRSFTKEELGESARLKVGI